MQDDDSYASFDSSESSWITDSSGSGITDSSWYQNAVALASVAFPGVYLRMDGGGITAPNGAGAGTVNCQYGAGPWEAFWLIRQPDGIAFMSREFSSFSPATPGTVVDVSRGVYLRMDGAGITAPNGAGAGTVNCQYGVGPWEKFRLELQPDGTTAIASVAFPGVYLRMDGGGITAPNAAGAGTVNCQYGVGPWERFKCIDVR